MRRFTEAMKRMGQLVMLLGASCLSLGLKADDAVTKTTAVAPNIPNKTRLAHVSLGDVTAIAARKGWLQEEFAKYNANVDLVNTTSYGQNGTTAALFDRGDLHISLSMMNGALQNRSQGLDVVFIWQSTNVVPRRAVTMVLSDSPVQSVSDLKGKTIGSSLTSCPYYAAVESLRSHGVEVDNEWRKGDVHYLNLSSTAASTSAFLAGRFEAGGWHPSSMAPLYVQNQVREIAVAVPDGIYTTTAGRSAITVTRQWANENPDLVKAFLVAWDRTVRWLYADHGAHLDEAATIAARELRVSKAVELFKLKDESQTAYNWGVTDRNDAIAAIKKFWKYQVAYKDPFFTKHQLTDKEIDALVDRRFYAGGEYFVDVGQKRLPSATLEKPAGLTTSSRLAQNNGAR